MLFIAANMMNQLLSPHKDKIILFLFPIILLSINSNWIFTPVTNFVPDPWFYLGYFRYFFDYAPVFPSNTHYFVERLTWNIPGYYLHNTLPPLLANHILHLIVYYVAIFSLYGTLNFIFNRRTALITALLMGSYPWFLRAAGWDYTDGTGIAHMLLLIFLLTRAHYSAQWRFWLLLAGVVLSSLLITNLFWLGFIPSWVIYFFVLNFQTRKFRSKHLILAVSYFFLGTLIMFVFAGAFYYWATGNYFFLANSIRFSFILTSDEGNRNTVITIYRHMRPYWHIVPVTVGVASTLQILLLKGEKRNLSFIAIYVLFMMAYGWLIFWHLYSIPLLTVFTYSSYVIPLAFLMLGALFSSRFNGLSQKQFNIVTLTSVGVLLLPLTLLNLISGLEQLQGNLFLIFLLTLLLLIVLIIPTKRISILTTTLVFSLFFFFIGENAYVYVSNPTEGRDKFLAIISASETLDAYYPDRHYGNFRLWFREDEHYDTFFSIASIYLYPWGSALGEPFSGREAPSEFRLVEDDIIHEGDDVVIISSDPQPGELLREANQSAAQQSAKLRLITTKTIQQGSTRFFLYFTKVSELQ